MGIPKGYVLVPIKGNWRVVIWKDLIAGQEYSWTGRGDSYINQSQSVIGQYRFMVANLNEKFLQQLH